MEPAMTGGMAEQSMRRIHCAGATPLRFVEMRVRQRARSQRVSDRAQSSAYLPSHHGSAEIVIPSTRLPGFTRRYAPQIRDSLAMLFAPKVK
jgi:hypothetical protein